MAEEAWRVQPLSFQPERKPTKPRKMNRHILTCLALNLSIVSTWAQPPAKPLDSPSPEEIAAATARAQEEVNRMLEAMSAPSLRVHWKLTLSVPAAGKEPNVLVASLLNVSAEPQYLQISEPPLNWTIRPKSKGRPVPMREDGEARLYRASRSGNVKRVRPGETWEYRFALNPLFDLIPGEPYEVSVSGYLGGTGPDIPDREKHRYTVDAVPLAFVARR
jgi:hypothetical protein